MTPDYDKAATKAAETLINYNICSAPVTPLPILKKMAGVFVISFTDMSKAMEMKRERIISMFGSKNVDAFTSFSMQNGKPQYMVAYNQMLSFILCQRALARELGHIILGHNDTIPEDVREEESRCFAHHLLCPRPLIHCIQAAGFKLTTEVLGNLTGCHDCCLASMRRLPAVNVPAELNRTLRDQFFPYVVNFFEYQRNARLVDVSGIADFGSYMDGYEE